MIMEILTISFTVRFYVSYLTYVILDYIINRHRITHHLMHWLDIIDCQLWQFVKIWNQLNRVITKALFITAHHGMKMTSILQIFSCLWHMDPSCLVLDLPLPCIPPSLPPPLNLPNVVNKFLTVFKKHFAKFFHAHTGFDLPRLYS